MTNKFYDVCRIRDLQPKYDDPHILICVLTPALRNASQPLKTQYGDPTKKKTTMKYKLSRTAKYSWTCVDLHKYDMWLACLACVDRTTSDFDAKTPKN